MMKVLLALIPWIAFALVLPVLQRRRPRLRDYPPPDREAAPSVSVIVPARNEAMNIGQCLTSLLGAEYPDLEVVMVDDRSEDGTGAIAAAIAERSGGRLRGASRSRPAGSASHGRAGRGTGRRGAIFSSSRTRTPGTGRS